MILKRILFCVIAIVGTTSCSYDNPLSIWADSTATTVFFGKITLPNGDDVSGPGFYYGTIHLRWSGDKPLKLVGINFKLPSNGNLSSEYTCTIDSEDLEIVTGLDSTLTMDPGQTIDGGSVVCLGLSAKTPNDTFIVTGTVSIRGFTGTTTDQKFFRATNKVSLYWFPQQETL